MIVQVQLFQIDTIVHILKQELRTITVQTYSVFQNKSPLLYLFLVYFILLFFFCPWQWSVFILVKREGAVSGAVNKKISNLLCFELNVFSKQTTKETITDERMIAF